MKSPLSEILRKDKYFYLKNSAMMKKKEGII